MSEQYETLDVKISTLNYSVFKLHQLNKNNNNLKVIAHKGLGVITEKSTSL